MIVRHLISLILGDSGFTSCITGFIVLLSVPLSVSEIWWDLLNKATCSC